MAKGTNGVTVVSIDRLQLFKQLQDTLNAATFLGIHATADAAKKLETAVTIDGISFDGSANITLPTKVVHVYSNTVEGVTKYYSDAEKTKEVTEFDYSKLYVDRITNEHKHFNGTTLVAAAAKDNVDRIALSEKGVAGGVATLDEDGLVPADQLPSYVDDVVEIMFEEGKSYLVDKDGNKISELTTDKMEKGKIYVDINATIDGTYRFGGSTSGLVKIGNSVSTADRAVNDKDGNEISATYVKVDPNASLMTNAQAQQLQTLVDATYEEVTTDGIRNLFDATTLATYDEAHQG